MARSEGFEPPTF